MKKSITYLIFGFLISVCSFQQADAEPLPSGSYSQSCSNCKMELKDMVGKALGNTYTYKAKVLSCKCKKEDQSKVDTILQFAQCTKDIQNCNGRLVCGSCGLPDGNYSNSCRDCTGNDSSMTCTCRRADGSWNSTRLDNCSHEVSNCNGNLKCGWC